MQTVNCKLQTANRTLDSCTSQLIPIFSFLFPSLRLDAWVIRFGDLVVGSIETIIYYGLLAGPPD